MSVAHKGNFNSLEQFYSPCSLLNPVGVLLRCLFWVEGIIPGLIAVFGDLSLQSHFVYCPSTRYSPTAFVLRIGIRQYHRSGSFILLYSSI
jgi:hypothetical protein